ncbi:12907_t:CDS:2 [Gigaspora rosea]|nr:12907_t:CDS:2 [Gigaspora rosea]
MLHVINTANGNIELTAAHCLLDDDGNQYNLSYLSFSPGYDNGTNGPLGVIPVADIAIPYTHLLDPQTADYALVRFEFRDPNRGSATLQDYTGALGWRFDIGNNEPTSVLGYPKDGDLENCARDSEHLCKWQGIIAKLENYHAISNVDIGEGASGGPFISQYNTETNLGYTYAIYDATYDEPNLSVGDIWHENTFKELLLRITP